MERSLNELLLFFAETAAKSTVASFWLRVARSPSRRMLPLPLAVEYVFTFTLAAGLLVLIATLQATHDERMRESAILKTLGATRARVRAGLLAEFCVLGAVAGLLAAVIASILSYVLAEYVFNIVYHFNLLVWPLGMVAGVLGMAVVGLMGMRPVLEQTPVEVLRRI